MATDPLLAATNRIRRRTNGISDEHSQLVAQAYTDAYETMADRIVRDHERRMEQYGQVTFDQEEVLLAEIGRELDALAPGAATEINRGIRRQVEHGIRGGQQQVELGLSDVGVQIGGLNQGAVDEMAQRALGDQDITKLLNGANEAYRAKLTATLLKRQVLGDNPKVAARELRKEMDGLKGGTLARWMTVARTEMNDASRRGLSALYMRHSDVLRGKEWIATLDERTCMACVALDGTILPLDAPEQQHQNCRCSLLPVIREFPNVKVRKRRLARNWFKAQKKTTQRQMMGNAAYAAYRKGEISLADFAWLKQNHGWRDAIYQSSLEQARENAFLRSHVFLATMRKYAVQGIAGIAGPFDDIALLALMTSRKTLLFTLRNRHYLSSLSKTPEGRRLLEQLLTEQIKGEVKGYAKTLVKLPSKVVSPLARKMPDIPRIHDLGDEIDRRLHQVSERLAARIVHQASKLTEDVPIASIKPDAIILADGTVIDLNELQRAGFLPATFRPVSTDIVSLRQEVAEHIYELSVRRTPLALQAGFKGALTAETLPRADSWSYFGERAPSLRQASQVTPGTPHAYFDPVLNEKVVNEELIRATWSRTHAAVRGGKREGTIVSVVDRIELSGYGNEVNIHGRVYFSPEIIDIDVVQHDPTWYASVIEQQLLMGRMAQDSQFGWKKVADFHRVLNFDTASVYHASLFVDKAYEGYGFATFFNFWAFNYYLTHGIREVRVSTTQIGGYTWATHGFEFNDTKSPILFVDSRRDEIRRWIDRGYFTEQDLARYLNEILANAERGGMLAYELSQLGREQSWMEVDDTGVERRMWFGKKVMIGQGWSGKLFMVPPAPGEMALRPKIRDRILYPKFPRRLNPSTSFFRQAVDLEPLIRRVLVTALQGAGVTEATAIRMQSDLLLDRVRDALDTSPGDLTLTEAVDLVLTQDERFEGADLTAARFSLRSIPGEAASAEQIHSASLGGMPPTEPTPAVRPSTQRTRFSFMDRPTTIPEFNDLRAIEIYETFVEDLSMAGFDTDEDIQEALQDVWLRFHSGAIHMMPYEMIDELRLIAQRRHLPDEFMAVLVRMYAQHEGNFENALEDTIGTIGMFMGDDAEVNLDVVREDIASSPIVERFLEWSAPPEVAPDVPSLYPAQGVLTNAETYQAAQRLDDIAYEVMTELEVSGLRHREVAGTLRTAIQVLMRGWNPETATDHFIATQTEYARATFATLLERHSRSLLPLVREMLVNRVARRWQEWLSQWRPLLVARYLGEPAPAPPVTVIRATDATFVPVPGLGVIEQERWRAAVAETVDSVVDETYPWLFEEERAGLAILIRQYLSPADPDDTDFYLNVLGNLRQMVAEATENAIETVGEALTYGSQQQLDAFVHFLTLQLRDRFVNEGWLTLVVPDAAAPAPRQPVFNPDQLADMLVSWLGMLRPHAHRVAETFERFENRPLTFEMDEDQWAAWLTQASIDADVAIDDSDIEALRSLAEEAVRMWRVPTLASAVVPDPRLDSMERVFTESLGIDNHEAELLVARLLDRYNRDLGALEINDWPVALRALLDRYNDRPEWGAIIEYDDEVLDELAQEAYGLFMTSEPISPTLFERNQQRMRPFYSTGNNLELLPSGDFRFTATRGDQIRWIDIPGTVSDTELQSRVSDLENALREAASSWPSEPTPSPAITDMPIQILRNLAQEHVNFGIYQEDELDTFLGSLDSPSDLTDSVQWRTAVEFALRDAFGTPHGIDSDEVNDLSSALAEYFTDLQPTQRTPIDQVMEALDVSGIADFTAYTEGGMRTFIEQRLREGGPTINIPIDVQQAYLDYIRMNPEDFYEGGVIDDWPELMQGSVDLRDWLQARLPQLFGPPPLPPVAPQPTQSYLNVPSAVVQPTPPPQPLPRMSVQDIRNLAAFLDADDASDIANALGPSLLNRQWEQAVEIFESPDDAPLSLTEAERQATIDWLLSNRPFREMQPVPPVVTLTVAALLEELGVEGDLASEARVVARYARITGTMTDAQRRIVQDYIEARQAGADVVGAAADVDLAVNAGTQEDAPATRRRVASLQQDILAEVFGGARFGARTQIRSQEQVQQDLQATRATGVDAGPALSEQERQRLKEIQLIKDSIRADLDTGRPPRFADIKDLANLEGVTPYEAMNRVLNDNADVFSTGDIRQYLARHIVAGGTVDPSNRYAQFLAESLNQPVAEVIRQAYEDANIMGQDEGPGTPRAWGDNYNYQEPRPGIWIALTEPTPGRQDGVGFVVSVADDLIGIRWLDGTESSIRKTDPWRRVGVDVLPVTDQTDTDLMALYFNMGLIDIIRKPDGVYVVLDEYAFAEAAPDLAVPGIMTLGEQFAVAIQTPDWGTFADAAEWGNAIKEALRRVIPDVVVSNEAQTRLFIELVPETGAPFPDSERIAEVFTAWHSELNVAGQVEDMDLESLTEGQIAASLEDMGVAARRSLARSLAGQILRLFRQSMDLESSIDALGSVISREDLEDLLGGLTLEDIEQAAGDVAVPEPILEAIVEVARYEYDDPDVAIAADEETARRILKAITQWEDYPYQITPIEYLGNGRFRVDVSQDPVTQTNLHDWGSQGPAEDERLADDIEGDWQVQFELPSRPSESGITDALRRAEQTPEAEVMREATVRWNQEVAEPWAARLYAAIELVFREEGLRVPGIDQDVPDSLFQDIVTSIGAEIDDPETYDDILEMDADLFNYLYPWRTHPEAVGHDWEEMVLRIRRLFDIMGGDDVE